MMKSFIGFAGMLMFTLLYSCKEKKNDGREIEVSPHTVFFEDADTFYADWSRENTLIYHIPNDPAYLHPTNHNSYSGRLVLSLTHNTLLSWDNLAQKLIPQLVKTLPEESADHLQYIYEIREEAAWDNGDPITAEDVIFTYKIHKCPLTDNANSKPYFENIETILADNSNSRRFTIVMKKPYIQNVAFTIDYPILSQKFFDPSNVMAQYRIEQFNDTAFHSEDQGPLKIFITDFNDGKYGNDPALFYGSGPYKVEVWDRRISIVLKRKPGNWMTQIGNPTAFETAYPEKIILKIIPDENAYMLEAKSQGIDYSNFLSTKVLLELKSDTAFNRNYHSAFTDNYNMNYVGMNTRPDGVEHKKIFTDVKVRHAMALLTPVDQIIEVLAYGKASRWPCMVSPLKREFNNDLQLVPFDIEAAKKLLDEAGWVDSNLDGIRDKVVDGERISFEFEITYAASLSQLKDVATMISEAMYQAGVKMNQRPVDPSLTATLAYSHDFDMIFLAWANPTFMEDYTQLWHTSSWVSGGGNFTGFGNAQSDALIDSIKYTLNDSLRIQMSKRLQKIVYDEQPYIFMYSPYRKVFIHKRFGNAVITPDLPNTVIGNLRLLAGGSKVYMEQPMFN